MPSNLATSSQRSYLLNLYSKGIGEYRARWYLAQLKDRGLTKSEASKEIARLLKIRETAGPTAMKPENWEEIKPGEETLDAFYADWGSRVKVVRDKL